MAIEPKDNELERAISDLRDKLVESGLIEISEDNLFSLSEEFHEIGVALFLLYWGSQINHKENSGYRLIPVALDSADKVYFIKSKLAEEQHLKIIHSLSSLISLESSDRDKDSFIQDFLAIPIDIHYSQLMPFLELMPFLKSGFNIDPLQILVYTILRQFLKVVYIEATVKEWEKEEIEVLGTKCEWDVIAYDKDKDKLILVEITTSEKGDALFNHLSKKLSYFIFALYRGYHVVYIAKIPENKNSKIKKFEFMIDHLRNNWKQNFHFINTYFKFSEDNEFIIEDLQQTYDNLCDELGKIVRLL